MAMNIIGRLNDVALVCDPDVFTLVWIEQHLPVLFPFLKLVEVCLRLDDPLLLYTVGSRRRTVALMRWLLKADH